MATTIKDFIALLQQSIREKQLVRLVLGNKRAANDWKNLLVKPVQIKQGYVLQLVYRYATNDVTKNESEQTAMAIIEQCLLTQFLNADLFTTTQTIQLTGKPNGSYKLVKKLTDQPVNTASTAHDRVKHRLIQPQQKAYLQQLGITSADGVVKKDKQDKYRQLNHYIDIIHGIVKDLGFTDGLTVADMGSGKGYLTFALYDYLTNTLGIQCQVTGIELRKNLVDHCNEMASKNGYKGLQFVEGAIGTTPLNHLDLLIALHACDTATDDAIYSGIEAGAKVIICAPCCHKEIRRQLNPTGVLQLISKHGILAERQAEMLTDSIRALLLEIKGYKTKVFEFISTEHTPKNVLIVGTKSQQPPSAAQLATMQAQLQTLKQTFGIGHQHLEQLLQIQ